MALLLGVAAAPAAAQTVAAGGTPSYISSSAGDGRFALSGAGRSAPIVASSQDYPGVIRAVNSLRADIGRVTGREPVVSLDTIPAPGDIVVVGTLGRSPLIDRLSHDGALDTSGIAGRWEAFLVQVVEHPWPGVDRALIIAGSDKRGTTYGIYDLSAQIGVSPWYWWADVPVQQRRELFVLPGRHSLGPPAVKYRGIFLNDEAPALSGWARQTFGGFNHQFYEKVFELLLRLKANYLWPAMWGNAFNEDDTLNARLADEYGIVMGTSHHEPMLRAQQEWRRHGSGPWNYEANGAVLRAFWEQGIRNMGSHESIVTIGMRGDGDMPMSERSNIALLERIVADQRRILSEVTGQGPATVPQLWALYKEVQDYYDRGMRVPDDVTLLFSDDNWGNIRRLPEHGAPPRDGGYGLYYHFDYVGGPRNYKWINTNSIPRVWEQLHLAYAHGVDRIWIVNVGDLKPMELPIQFFLGYAWNPELWPAQRLPEYARAWAEQQFGPGHAREIAAILADYGRYSARRKPELLSPTTYALNDYREAETIVADYAALAARAERIAQALPAEYRDAYYQLVLHPVLALSNLNDLYATVGRNRLYASQGRAATNDLAARARQLFARDAAITRYYNDTLAGGKWQHMMDQTHIGYTYWQEPRQNSMPEVREISLPADADMGVAIEGSDRWWPSDSGEAALPEFDPYREPTSYVDVFNRGQTAFEVRAQSDAPWLVVTPSRGRVDQERRLRVSVDWRRAPTGAGVRRVGITIAGAGRRVVVYAKVRNPAAPRRDQVRGFVEGNGYVSIEAEHFTRAVDAAPIRWVRIPGLGRTLSGMTAFPVTVPRQSPAGDTPHLEYRLYLFDGGDVGVRSVSDNAIVTVSRHRVAGPGAHVLRFWQVDPGVVLQKLVVERRDVRPSYLGPPESFHRP